MSKQNVSKTLKQTSFLVSYWSRLSLLKFGFIPSDLLILIDRYQWCPGIFDIYDKEFVKSDVINAKKQKISFSTHNEKHRVLLLSSQPIKKDACEVCIKVLQRQELMTVGFVSKLPKEVPKYPDTVFPIYNNWGAYGLTDWGYGSVYKFNGTSFDELDRKYYYSRLWNNSGNIIKMKMDFNQNNFETYSDETLSTKYPMSQFEEYFNEESTVKKSNKFYWFLMATKSVKLEVYFET